MNFSGIDASCACVPWCYRWVRTWGRDCCQSTQLSCVPHQKNFYVLFYWYDKARTPNHQTKPPSSVATTLRSEWMVTPVICRFLLINMKKKKKKPPSLDKCPSSVFAVLCFSSAQMPTTTFKSRTVKLFLAGNCFLLKRLICLLQQALWKILVKPFTKPLILKWDHLCKYIYVNN